MTTAVPCVLGCLNADGIPYPAAPGQLACTPCEQRLMGVLGDLADRLITLQTADALAPHSAPGERGTPGYGPRSPALDALIAHGDMRTKWSSELGHGVVATVESWARCIREEVGALPPAERATFGRELRTIRFHWDHVMSSPWLDEFAREMREALSSLLNAGRLTERAMRIGPCPGLVAIGEEVFTSETIYRECGATLRVRASDDEIRCRTCGTVWPRSRWREIGDPWADYATLADDYGVAVGTLWRWASEDRKNGLAWRTEKRGGRLLVHRDDAEASRARRHHRKVA
ncbi:hypothetical protein [Amycolatopsis taiwanensis]|uniref:hypothetical protein n=1 Tax=Amycolatopsis taiwanensis TaxID=342230 RepID=UPI000489E2CD|nr:hypothetical protein [Amycolatopsis taiwanensis]